MLWIERLFALKHVTHKKTKISECCLIARPMLHFLSIQEWDPSIWGEQEGIIAMKTGTKIKMYYITDVSLESLKHWRSLTRSAYQGLLKVTENEIVTVFFSWHSYALFKLCMK